MNYKKLSILGLSYNSLTYAELLAEIEDRVSASLKTAVTYANAACVMNYRISDDYRRALQKFTVIHPDGIGIFLAEKILHGCGLNSRMTGSDFYPLFIEKAIEKRWSLYIFGDTIETLQKIPQRYPNLNIVGFTPGFNYSDRLHEEITRLKPDIVLAGLGVPRQEIWISENWKRLPASVYLAVGGGLQVLAGTKKRGSKIIQKSGFEWAVRLLYEPIRLWKRYIVWMPVFSLMVVLQKIRGRND